MTKHTWTDNCRGIDTGKFEHVIEISAWADTGTTEFIGINGATTDELWQLLQDEVAQLHNWYDAEAKNGNLSPRTDEPQIALVRQRPAPDEDGDYAGLDDWPIIADWK